MTTVPRHATTEAPLDDRTDRARAAVKAFRSLIPTLSAYASALSGKPVQVVPHPSSGGHTDGKTIYYRPPIALGEKVPHNRALCEQRDPSTGLMDCPACSVREQVLVAIYHEIAHIAFDSFKSASDTERALVVTAAAERGGDAYSQHIAKAIQTAPDYIKNSTAGLAGVISKYLPLLLNFLEDARIEESMFRLRPGTRRMFNADNRRSFSQGTLDKDGKLVTWKDQPRNAQIMCALYTAACEYEYDDWFDEKVVADTRDEVLSELVAQVTVASDALVVYGLAFRVLKRLKEMGYLEEPELDPPSPEPEEQSDESGDSGEPEEAPAQPEASEQPDESPSEPEAGDGGSDSEPDEGDGTGGDGVRGSDEESEHGDDSGDASEGDSEAGGSAPEDDLAEADSSPDPSEGEGDADSEEDASGGGSTEDSGDDDSSGEDGKEGLPEDNLGSSDSGGSGSGSPSDGSPESDSSGADDPSSEPVDSSSEVPGEGEVDAGSDSDAGSSGDESGVPDAEVDLDDLHGDSESADLSDSMGHGSPSPDLESSEDVDESSTNDLDSDMGIRDDLGLRDSERGDSADHSDPGDDPGTGEPEEQAVSLIDDSSNDDKPWGAFDDVAELVASMLHETPDVIEEAPADTKAVDTAILQGAYFETPSRNIIGVREHIFGEPQIVDGQNTSTAWDLSLSSYYNRRHQDGRKTPLDIPEAILAPALRHLRVVFADNQRSKKERHLKAGKINARVLGKRAPADDERLFQRKQIPGQKNYFVVIGWDISGSNYGENIALGKRAVTAQAHLLDRLGVKFAIVAHTAHFWSPAGGRKDGMALDIFWIKKPDEPFNQDIITRLETTGPAAANLDGHALEFMRRLADKRREERKVLMYYSDGKMPAENHDEELVILQREIKTCRKKGYTLVGVGINTDSPKRHGLDTVEVAQDSDIRNVVTHLEKRLDVR